MNYTNGEWQGYYDIVLIAAIDLLKEKDVSKVTISFLVKMTQLQMWPIKPAIEK